MATQQAKQQIEIQGLKGLRSTPFRKVFKTQAAFDKWFEANGENVQILATRSGEEG